MNIRKYRSEDCKYIAELFYDTIHSVNAKDYTEEQLNIWATGNVDLIEWNNSFLEHYTIVAIEGDVLVGFGDVDITGYLDKLFVHKNYQGKGIATAICNELESMVNTVKIRTHASITAKPFFIGRGYKVIRQQQIVRNEIVLINYVMEKQLNLL